MALSIKDQDTDRLAREVASIAEESLTVAIRTALEERLERIKAAKARKNQQSFEDLHKRYITKARSYNARHINTGVMPEDIDELLYDENGLPA
ncbi:MAG: type II toxin-antitoxin system VapB family antitoxin [Actinomycetaceae bacterium]|nr:type II toxin-antitoxin system VapB family antitoxin [Arcanobacterium sp.]MDD7505186.1 type II toxin-antitoxin system VapB family antitoxin [Actinomycetaceae bacterium]MDY6144079.1 type II toxin-antitoxin system VapB family antitoxin [Arcanobacterium sp.]